MAETRNFKVIREHYGDSGMRYANDVIPLSAEEVASVAHRVRVDRGLLRPTTQDDAADSDRRTLQQRAAWERRNHGAEGYAPGVGRGPVRVAPNSPESLGVTEETAGSGLVTGTDENGRRVGVGASTAAGVATGVTYQPGETGSLTPAIDAGSAAAVAAGSGDVDAETAPIGGNPGASDADATAENASDAGTTDAGASDTTPATAPEGATDAPAPAPAPAPAGEVAALRSPSGGRKPGGKRSK